jgi:hypothetical protein
MPPPSNATLENPVDDLVDYLAEYHARPALPETVRHQAKSHRIEEQLMNQMLRGRGYDILA